MDFGYVAGPGTSIALGGSEIAMRGDVNVTGDLNQNGVSITDQLQNITASPGVTDFVGEVIGTDITCEFVTASDSLSTPLLKSTTTGAVQVEIVNDTFDGPTLLNGGAVLYDASFVPSSGQVTLMSDVPQQTGVLNYTGNLGGNWSIETDFRYNTAGGSRLFCVYNTAGFPAEDISFDNHGGYSFALNNFYGSSFPVLIKYAGQSIPGASGSMPILSSDTTYTNTITCVGGTDFTYSILIGSTEIFNLEFTDIDRGPQSYFGAFGNNSTNVNNIFVERMLVTTGADNTSIALGSSEIDITGDLRVNGVSITDQLQNITASPGVTDFVGEVIGTDITCEFVTASDSLSTPLLKSTTTGAVQVEIVNDTFDGPTLLNGGAVLYDASFVPSSGQVTLMSDVPQQTGVLNYTGNLGGNWSIETDFRYNTAGGYRLFCVYNTAGFPAEDINYDNHGGYSFAINFYGSSFPVLIKYAGQSIPGASGSMPILSSDTTYTNTITCVGGTDFTYSILNGSTEIFNLEFTDIDRGPQSYFGAFGNNATNVNNIFVERMLVTTGADNTSIALGSSEIDITGDLRVNGVSITDQLQNITASPGVTDFVGNTNTTGNIATAGLTSTGIVSTTISSEFVTASDSLSTPLLKSTTTGADNTSIALGSSEIDITGELRVNGVSITDQLQNITASPGVTDFVGNIIVGGNMSVDNNLQTDIITNLFNTLVVGDISVFADSFLNPTLANGGTFLTQTSLPTPGIPAIDTVNGWVQFTSETVPSQFAHIIYSDIGKIAQIRSAREMYFNHTLRIRDTSGRNGQGFIVYFSETAPTGTSSVLTNLHKAYAINIRTGIGRLDLNYNGANQIFENVFPIFDNDQDYEIGIRVVKNGMRNITFHFLVDGTEVFRTTQPYQATVDYFNHCGFAAYTTSLGNNTTDYLIRSMDFGYVAGPGTSIALGGSEIAMTGDVNVTGDLRVNTVLQDTGPDCYGQISSGNGEFTIALPEGIKRTLNTQDVPGLVLNTHFQGINQTNGVTFGYSIITPGTYRVSANVSTKLGDNSTEVHFGLYYLNILTGLTTPAEHQSVIGGITPIMPEPQNNKFVSQSINCILPGLAVHDWLFLGMKSMGGAQTATIQYLSMNIERLRTST